MNDRGGMSLRVLTGIIVWDVVIFVFLLTAVRQEKFWRQPSAERASASPSSTLEFVSSWR